jgi:alkanesulfonate monooxygenase SsuD/methylene tetrahydromethanopterin reductase-like flavin-dependent oxidoreductase (luciferase family)
MTTLGAVFLPQLPPERLRSVARAADEAGLDELWLWEDCFWESGIAMAAAALGWTERLRVAVGLLPVPLRNVGIAAMEVATLQRLFPGRIAIGVGHGVQDWMGQVGARAESPMTLLREYLIALGGLLRGEKLTTSGRYVNLDGVGLQWPPATPGPLYVGAVGPKTLRLAGEHADGTILTGGTTPQKVAEARRLVGEGKSIVVYLHCATGPDAVERLETERVTWDYEEGRDCYAVGDAPAVAAAVLRWAEAGADTVVLQPTPDDPDPEGFVRFVAREVAPLIR